MAVYEAKLLLLRKDCDRQCMEATFSNEVYQGRQEDRNIHTKRMWSNEMPTFGGWAQKWRNWRSTGGSMESDTKDDAAFFQKLSSSHI